jgi:hypothetical protein
MAGETDNCKMSLEQHVIPTGENEAAGKPLHGREGRGLSETGSELIKSRGGISR